MPLLLRWGWRGATGLRGRSCLVRGVVVDGVGPSHTLPLMANAQMLLASSFLTADCKLKERYGGVSTIPISLPLPTPSPYNITPSNSSSLHLTASPRSATMLSRLQLFLPLLPLHPLIHPLPLSTPSSFNPFPPSFPAADCKPKERYGTILTVVENSPSTHNLIVCTLCSCYPIAILGK